MTQSVESTWWIKSFPHFYVNCLFTNVQHSHTQRIMFSYFSSLGTLQDRCYKATREPFCIIRPLQKCLAGCWLLSQTSSLTLIKKKKNNPSLQQCSSADPEGRKGLAPGRTQHLPGCWKVCEMLHYHWAWDVPWVKFNQHKHTKPLLSICMSPVTLPWNVVTGVFIKSLPAHDTVSQRGHLGKQSTCKDILEVQKCRTDPFKDSST